MSLEAFRKIAEETGNEELQTAVSSFETSSKANLDRIGTLERDLQKSIEKRDRQAGIVKNTFGVDEITEESLKAFLDKGNPDESLKAENSKLAGMTEALSKEKQELVQKYNETVNRYGVEKQLMSLGAAEDTENAKAYDILMSNIMTGSSFDDTGNVIFKENDATVRNADGSPTTLADRYSQLKDSDEFSFLFKKKRSKSGSGANGSTSGVDNSTRNTRSKMSPSEKANYIRENGQDKYLKLPN